MQSRIRRRIDERKHPRVRVGEGTSPFFVCKANKSSKDLQTSRAERITFAQTTKRGMRIAHPSLIGAVNKDKSEPHRRVIRFGFLLSPPDIWVRQLAAGAVSDDKSEPNASSISAKVIVFVPSL